MVEKKSEEDGHGADQTMRRGDRGAEEEQPQCLEPVKERRPMAKRDARIMDVVVLGEREWSPVIPGNQVVANHQPRDEVRTLIGVPAYLAAVDAGGGLQGKDERGKHGEDPELSGVPPQAARLVLAGREMNDAHARAHLGRTG